MTSSLGKDLLNDTETADFDLILTDGTDKIATTVHRLVLKTSSPYFRRMLNSLYMFMFVLTIPKGTIVPALRLIKYFYSRDLRDLGDLEPTLRLCLQLECADLYAFLNQIHVKRDEEPKQKRLRVDHYVNFRKPSTRSGDRKTRRSKK